MNINIRNTKVKRNENKVSHSSNLKVSSSSKATLLDELDTNKQSRKLSKSLFTKHITGGSPLWEPVLESAPPGAKLSRPDDIIINKNNVSSCSNKEPGWESDTIKGRGWGWTGDGKRGKRPTNTNITFITDPERRKEVYGDYEHLWINFSKSPWNNNNKTNSEHMYIAKEKQSRKVLHSHSIVLIDDSECLDAGNSYDPYASSNECSSECSSECSYNHKSKNKK